MAFWNSSDIKINQKHQYQLNIGGVIWYVKTVKFPSISNEVKEFSTFTGGPPDYIPGIPKIDSFGITLADVFLEGSSAEEGTPAYGISTSAFFFWVFKKLEESVNERLLPIASSDGNYNIDWPWGDDWLSQNLSGGSEERLGSINEIVVTKLYGNKEKEQIKFFDCIPTKIDLGQGDYSSDDINEISLDFQPRGFRVETIGINDEGEEIIRQGLTKVIPVSPNIAADASTSLPNIAADASTSSQQTEDKKPKTPATVDTGATFNTWK
jgi:hypothetical protein